MDNRGDIGPVKSAKNLVAERCHLGQHLVARRSVGNSYQRFGSAEDREGSIVLDGVPFPSRPYPP